MSISADFLTILFDSLNLSSLAVTFYRFFPLNQQLPFCSRPTTRKKKSRVDEKCAFKKRRKKGKTFPPSFTRFLFTIIDRKITSTFKLFSRLLSLRKFTQSAVLFFFLTTRHLMLLNRDSGQQLLFSRKISHQNSHTQLHRRNLM